MDDQRCDVLIVGAGLAGLSTAWHLRHSGHADILVIEAEDRPGGWAKTDWTDGYGADRAIHVMYFRDRDVRAWVDDLIGGAWYEHQKHCVIDSRGVRTPFPFHANLYGRPLDVVIECLAGLYQAGIVAKTSPSPPVTFADWIARSFGAGVARHFMNPYNGKMWTVSPDEMGWAWMGDFIPTVEPERVLTGALAPASSDIGLNATFHYPHDGISAVADALAAAAGPISYRTRLVGLLPAARVALLDDGRRVRYERLVSTIPLTILARLAAPLPDAVQAAGGRLESLDLVLVDVGFTDPDQASPPVHWVYFPDPEVLAYRLHAVHTLSGRLVPPGHGLYTLEISHSPHRPLPAGSLRARIVADLLRTGWLRSADQVTFYRERRHGCAYVVPRVGFQDDAAVVRTWLETLHILSIGRYGSWKYCNSEDALIDGRQAARTLLAGAERVS